MILDFFFACGKTLSRRKKNVFHVWYELSWSRGNQIFANDERRTPSKPPLEKNRQESPLPRQKHTHACQSRSYRTARLLVTVYVVPGITHDNTLSQPLGHNITPQRSQYHTPSVALSHPLGRFSKLIFSPNGKSANPERGVYGKVSTRYFQSRHFNCVRPRLVWEKIGSEISPRECTIY